MQEMQVWSLGQENPLEEGMATHSSILAWEIQWKEEPGGYSPLGHKEPDKTEATVHAHTHWNTSCLYKLFLRYNVAATFQKICIL